MRVIIYATQPEIAQVITDQLSIKNPLCYSVKNFAQVQDLIEKSEYLPDLLIIDYLSFNHYFFNIYKHFERHRYHVPIVFFNDPHIMRPTRCDHWIAQIELMQNDYLKLNLETLRPILLELQEIIESPKIKPYIALLNPPESLPLALTLKPFTVEYFNQNVTDSIYELNKHLQLRQSLFYILKILNDNKTESISVNEIIKVYERDGKQMTEKSLKVLLSELRGTIRNHPECGYLIYSNKNQYRLVKFK